jgi:hypothetical protein
MEQQELRALIKLVREPRLVKRYNSVGLPLGVGIGSGLYDEVEVSRCHRDPARKRTPLRSSGNTVLRASESRTSESSRMCAEKGAEY